jgi:hypothetical protein
MATRKKAITKGKLSGLKEDGTPNAAWQKFIARMNLYETLPVKEWKNDQFIGYILKKYKEAHGVEFTLSYSGAPTKCKESYAMKRTILMLGFSEPEKIKDYIDFVFDNFLKDSILTSIGFFFTTSFILKYKQYLRKKDKITRTTELPPTYKQIISNFDLSLNTYGDLAFVQVAIDDDPENEDNEIYHRLFSEFNNNNLSTDFLKVIE